MSINTQDPSELPEYFDTGSYVYVRDPDDAVGQVIIAAAGHHPRLRITRAFVTVLAYSTAADVFAIEEQGGTDHATATAGAAIGQTVNFTITDDIFERNEAICVNLTTDGNAANSDMIVIQFESIH